QGRGVSGPSESAIQLQSWLERMQAGDNAAREALFAHLEQRMRRLTRKMKKGYPQIPRWEQTDDVLNSAILRLVRALETVHPTSPRHLLNLAALELRRELIDLKRHLFGPLGKAQKHESRELGGEAGLDPAAPSGDASQLTTWTEFHRSVDGL